MNTSEHEALDALRAANPVAPGQPLSAAQQARADETLRTILAGVDDLAARRALPRRLQLAAAAAAVVLGAALIPQFTSGPATATASEVLQEAAKVSAVQPDALSAGVTTQEYLQRTDTLGESRVITSFEAPVAGEVRVSTTAQGPHNPLLDGVSTLPISAEELSAAQDAQSVDALAQRLGGGVRGYLQLLLHPSLSSAQQSLVYEALAGQNITLGQAAQGDALDHFSTQDLEFSVLRSTGQLVRVVGLVAPGVDTTVSAAAILGCVSAVGVEGPAELSLGCADNNYLLQGLQWSNWSADVATATGQAVVNDCDPFCAEGNFHTKAVTVTVSERKECGYNARVYSRLEVKDDTGEVEVFDIGCAQS